MASNACFTAFSAAAPVPILHYYGLEDYTTAKKTLISALLLKGDKVGRRGVSEGYLSAEEADNPCAVSRREQPRITEGTALSRITEGTALRRITEGSASFWTRTPSNEALEEKWPTLTLPRTRNLLPQNLENLLARNSSAQAKFPLFRL